MDVFIYSLTDPRTNEIRYVGKAVNPHKRLYEHIKLAHKEKSWKAAWVRNLVSAGLEPQIDILQRIEDSNDQDWQAEECWWISYLRFIGCPLTNLDGGGRRGKSVSEITRKKMSAARKGKKMPPGSGEKIAASKRGIPRPRWVVEKAMATKASRSYVCTSEVRLKLSLANKGKFRTQETKLRMSIAQKGHTVSIETRIKISQVQIGRKQSPETVAKRIAKNTGRKRTPEMCARISAAKLAAFKLRRENANSTAQ